MKLFPVSQISDIDAYTVQNEPISSIDLMERASLAFCCKFIGLYGLDIGVLESIDVLVGPGNNGGDALAIARLLSNKVNRIRVWLSVDDNKLSADALINLNRLEGISNIECSTVAEVHQLQAIDEKSVIIDGLFGSGLNRPLQGTQKELVQLVNSLENDVVAIDIPSGLMGEDNSANDLHAIIKADITISFQFLKLCFLLPENAEYVGLWKVVDIGLHRSIINQKSTPYYYTGIDEAKSLLKKRNAFAHKGKFGHALLLAGSYGKMGAAVLASRACLRAGVGLLTAHVPRLGYDIIQTAVPEAMASVDRSDILISEFPELDTFNAIGVGPGMGTKPNSCLALKELLKMVSDKPLVLDADAINILGIDPECLSALPPNTILTPHPGEFDRLVGKLTSGFERLQKAIGFAKKHQCIVVLKGAYSAVIDSSGDCYFNSSGNAGMATAGSGDALTGVVLALLAQGYEALDAARLAVYLHGLSGDIYIGEQAQESLTASELIDYLGKAFYRMQQEK
ncbi:NAD(P)H-hydrate dehydratase [Carboxylicivirga sp. N1Y90]|uniref:NAD(P)H-hydrate dehydratase n=1 Tax=Carboxylicivirga fragile TaxID=3417571 RepID=UPI003D32CAC7|nr:NAD(P)H-hydrate dehydratase [Marinilabiliaceae bacterium N1Y90]